MAVGVEVGRICQVTGCSSGLLARTSRRMEREERTEAAGRVVLSFGIRSQIGLVRREGQPANQRQSKRPGSSGLSRLLNKSSST